MNVREFVFRGFEGCSDHACVVKGKQKGMGTNGGCKCMVNMSRGQLSLISQRLKAIESDEVSIGN